MTKWIPFIGQYLLEIDVEQEERTIEWLEHRDPDGVPERCRFLSALREECECAQRVTAVASFLLGMFLAHAFLSQ